jgi:ABC-type multidrug transport system ATPase subunit
MQFLLMMGLASRPKLLLLDEITAVIDIEGQKYFLDLLREYVSDGGTVVISTNILSELNDYTDHLLLIQETKLKVDASVKDLQKKFYVLKKTEEHPVFSHADAARIRNDNDGKELFLIPRKVIDEDSEVLKFKMDYGPKLEDILTLYFQLKEENLDEELVA